EKHVPPVSLAVSKPGLRNEDAVDVEPASHAIQQPLAPGFNLADRAAGEVAGPGAVLQLAPPFAACVDGRIIPEVLPQAVRATVFKAPFGQHRAVRMVLAPGAVFHAESHFTLVDNAAVAVISRPCAVGPLALRSRQAVATYPDLAGSVLHLDQAQR